MDARFQKDGLLGCLLCVCIGYLCKIEAKAMKCALSYVFVILAKKKKWNVVGRIVILFPVFQAFQFNVSLEVW